MYPHTICETKAQILNIKFNNVSTHSDKSPHVNANKKSIPTQTIYQIIKYFVIFHAFMLVFIFSGSISSPSCINQLDFDHERESITIHRIVRKNDKKHKIQSIQLIAFLIVNINSDHPPVLTPIM